MTRAKQLALVRVNEWLKQNPDGDITDLVEYMKTSKETVARYVKEIEKVKNAT